MIFQNVFIIGATGSVGKKLVEQIVHKGDTSPERHVHPTRIVGLASTTQYVFDSEGLSDGKSLAFANKKGSASSYDSPDQLIKISNGRNGPDHLVFVDVTSAKDITAFHLKIIEETPHAVVTANKNPLTFPDYATFKRLTRQPFRYDYSCSVMAGAEAIVALRNLRDVGDPPMILEGCFSGTLGYISSQLEKRPFSEILAEAKRLEYTEPHPRDDLSGLDVARKLLILARTAGFAVDLKDVNVKPFIPTEFLNGSDVEAFMESSKKLDGYFDKLAHNAASKGNVLRYVARMDARDGRPAMTVSLQEVKANSQLGALKLNQNKIVIVSNQYPANSPKSIEAPGSGPDLTAQNVRIGICNVLPERQFKQ